MSYLVSVVGCAEVLVLDEPTAGLDPESRRLVWHSISAERLLQREKQQSLSCILATHSTDALDALCQRVALLHNGQLTQIGPFSSPSATA